MRDLAQRVVERSRVEEPRFNESTFLDDDFPRDIVTVLTEGSLGGIRLASWLPVAGQIMRQEGVRESIAKRAQDCWRMHAFSHILRAELLVGPKGKLPA